MPTLRSARRRGPLLAWAWALAALAAAGCGGKGPYPVRGKLVYEDTGQPVKELSGFDVTFTSEKLGVSARGTINEDGEFQLTTRKDNDGAPPGEYVVILTQPHRKPERPYIGDPVVDLAYEDPEKSDLKAEVKAEPNDFTFKLRRIKGKAR
jgi:hypothetical protein